jgi:hypothetical protein
MPPTETTPAPARLAAYTIAAGLTLNTALALFALITHPHINSDFLAFWSFPRFAAAQPVAGIYDAARLRTFQQTLYAPFYSFYPYLYPPTLLVVTWWLKFFSFRTAQIIWTIAGLAVFLAGAKNFFPTRWAPILAMLACPAALITGATGETAFFTSGLILGGFGLLPRSKILAGILFGLLTLKPQLGVLIPFALLALGEWRAIIAAAATAAALIAISCIAFPPSLWLVWSHTLPAYQTEYFAAAKSLNLNIIVTPAANLITLGCPPRAAWLIQSAITLAIAALTFITFRRRQNSGLAIAGLFTGAFLAVPHAYAYDTITLTAALALIFERTRFTWPATLAAGIIFLAPFMLLSPASPAFLYAVPETIMYLLIMRLAFTPSPRKTASYEPEDQRIRA